MRFRQLQQHDGFTPPGVAGPSSSVALCGWPRTIPLEAGSPSARRHATKSTMQPSSSIWRSHAPYDVSRRCKVHMTRQAKIACCPPSVVVPIITLPASFSYYIALERMSRSLLFPCRGPLDNDNLRANICGLDVNNETQPQSLPSVDKIRVS